MNVRTAIAATLVCSMTSLALPPSARAADAAEAPARGELEPAPTASGEPAQPAGAPVLPTFLRLPVGAALTPAPLSIPLTRISDLRAAAGSPFLAPAPKPVGLIKTLVIVGVIVVVVLLVTGAVVIQSAD